MDELEKYISTNRSEFDGDEPSVDHFNRFESKLRASKQAKKRKHWLVVGISSIAAAIALLVTLTVSIDTQQYYDPCNLTAEVKEVSSYYAARLDLEIEKLKELALLADEETRDELMNDIRTMEQDSANFLQQVCLLNDSEEEQLNIINQHFRVAIDAVQTTISLLESNREV